MVTTEVAFNNFVLILYTRRKHAGFFRRVGKLLSSRKAALSRSVNKRGLRQVRDVALVIAEEPNVSARMPQKAYFPKLRNLPIAARAVTFKSPGSFHQLTDMPIYVSFLKELAIGEQIEAKSGFFASVIIHELMHVIYGVGRRDHKVADLIAQEVVPAPKSDKGQHQPGLVERVHRRQRTRHILSNKLTAALTALRHIEEGKEVPKRLVTIAIKDLLAVLAHLDKELKR